jgi:hypothetical protein
MRSNSIKEIGLLESLKRLQLMAEEIYETFSDSCELPEDELIEIINHACNGVSHVKNFDYTEYYYQQRQGALEAQQDERDGR